MFRLKSHFARTSIIIGGTLASYLRYLKARGRDDHTTQPAQGGPCGRGPHRIRPDLAQTVRNRSRSQSGGESFAALAGGDPRERDPRRAARQEAADQIELPAAELRDADRIFPHADHAQRGVLRAVSSCPYPRGGREDV